MAKKIVHEKRKNKKPVASCYTGLTEVRRIRNNEQAKLRRREKKLEDIPRRQKGAKGKADAIRKEMKAIGRNITSAQQSLKVVNGYCERFTNIKKERTALKAQATRINKKLEKMYESGSTSAEYKKLNNEFFKVKNKIKGYDDKLNGALLGVNKELGFGMKDLGKFLTKKEYKQLVDEGELSDEEQASISGDRPEFGRNYKDTVEKLREEAAAQFEEQIESGEELKDSAWQFLESDVFWKIWRDFDKNELDNLSSYKKVIFINLDGDKQIINADQKRKVAMTASKFWKEAEDIGSDVVVTKSVTTDGTKLKYEMEHL